MINKAPNYRCLNYIKTRYYEIKAILIEKGDEIMSIPLTLRNDYAFKRIFGSEENKDILKELLSVILDLDKNTIKDLRLQNNDLQGAYFDDKKSVLDVKLIFNDDTKVNVEMQNIWQDNYIKRVFYYWARRYTEDFTVGRNYKDLSKTIVINILGQTFPYQDDMHSVIKPYFENTKKLASDLLEIHFLDLTKINMDDMNDLNKWMLFIKTDEREVRNMLAQKDDTLKKVNDVLDVFWSNKQERYAYEARFMYECDMTSIREDAEEKGMKRGLERGIQQGLKEGLQQGIEDGKKLSIVDFYKNGADIDTISKFSKLSTDEIKSILIEKGAIL